MPSLTELMCQHRSIRKFKTDKLSSEQLETIITAAKSASTSSFMQCTSIIRVTDMAMREQLVSLTGNQAYVASAAEFLVFCADYHRHLTIKADAKLGFSEQLLTAAIDAGLMAENAMLAAESMGLGGVFIGGIRNNPLDVAKLLQLPQQVFALFGLCLGYPAQQPEVKPRLPNAVLLHENTYQALDNQTIKEYDQTVSQYYQTRTDNKKSNTWSSLVTEKLAKEARPFIKDALQEQGFLKK